MLAIGWPLVLSLSSTTVMQFTDRVFLGNYSVDTIAAATPSGITIFLFIALFMGVASYTNVFVAQYVGASAPARVGAALWQGIYFCLFSGLILASLNFLAQPFFHLIDHPLEVQRLEVIYFRILSLGAGLAVLGPALGCFFSGRGLTRPIMVVNMIGAAINIPLDYALINGRWFFPEMGIAGAALATVMAWTVVVALLGLLVFTAENDRRFAVRRSRRFDRELFGRLMKYGLPGGIQFFIDIFAIAFFVFMIGRLGKAELAATNIAFSINHLSFMPVIGLSIAISTLVGQAIGRGRPENGAFATNSGLHLAVAYMALIALLFVLAPEWLMRLFRPRDFSPDQYRAIMTTGVVLLRFVALYTLFDGVAITYAGAIKGAGDTRFVMWTMATLSLLTMILPVYVGATYLGFSLYAMWICLTLYIIALSVVFWRRFAKGKWKGMRVIEAQPVPAAD